MNSSSIGKQECAILLAMTILIAIATIGLVVTLARASSLSMEPPPPLPLFMNGTQVNLTADDKDRDISIDPVEPIIFQNGTVSIPTLGATDADINEFPPVGITVLIQNDSITVTKNQVQIVDPTLQQEIARQAVESNDDGGNGDE